MLNNERLNAVAVYLDSVESRELYKLVNAYLDAKAKGLKTIDVCWFYESENAILESLRIMDEFGITEFTMSNNGTNLQNHIQLCYRNGWRITDSVTLKYGEGRWIQTKPALLFQKEN
ncbi:MAG: hypothetical protein IJD43_05080 [Thermoguttaceae bacterium]|nr:hypothetical protein [Thermoguttaceae bacterium]